MIKFFTKKDKKIQELEQEIAVLKTVNAPQILRISETDLIPYKAGIVLEDGMPIDSAKRIIACKFEERLMDHIEYDVKDGVNNRKILEGTLYVGCRKF